MSNTFGERFRLTTFGESHGTAIGGIVDGCPAGIDFDETLVADEMARRHIGDAATPRHEADRVEILSGVFEGVTLGTPIAFVIANQDANSDEYSFMKELFRPGHADFTYEQRYGVRDHRGGGRASGRETAARVAGGAIAKMLLKKSGITMHTTVLTNQTPANNDSVGGVVECMVEGVKAGMGNPVFDKLGARLAYAMMSIPSSIGFEMGEGFAAAEMTGSQYRDNWVGNRNSGVPTAGNFSTITNHCGGIQGGISNGMPLVFRTAFHPPVTIAQATDYIDRQGAIKTLTPDGRHDRCHVHRTAVVVEAMTALVLADYLVIGD